MNPDQPNGPSNPTPRSRRNLLMRGATGVAALFGAGAWSPTDILNNLSGLDQTRSIAYGPGPRRTLDVYAPPDARGAPVVVFFYGGSWQRGSKSMYRFVAASLVSQGFVVVIPDYRVYPEVRYSGFVQDGAQAMAWTKANATRFGGDPRKLFIMGHSAGAYIAAMLAFDGRWLADVGMNARADLSGFIGLAGPYDFLPIEDPTIQKIFGGPAVRSTQPIEYVGAGEPPSFIGSTPGDTLVDPGNSVRLAAKLRRFGVPVVEKVYPGANHLTLIGAFAPILGPLASVRYDVVEFITVNSGRRVSPR